ncbi:MAG: AMP-binding protein [Ignavibacteria bacterium]|jgi:long-chain acyl-CoA synthetase|nr:AMP-binding protein [Ignavibacteria bacterium]
MEDSNKVALIIGKKQITYHSLMQRIYLSAARLTAKPGERVMVYSENREGYVYALYAIIYKKAIYNTWFHNLKADTLQKTINEVNPSAIFVSPKLYPLLSEAIDIDETHIQILMIDELEEMDVPEDTPVADLTRDPNDTIFAVYTAAITSTHKLCELTHGNILATINNMKEANLITESDRVLVLLPFYNTWILLSTIVVPLYVGATCVCVNEVVGQTIIDKLYEHKVSVFVGVKSAYLEVLKVLMERVNGSRLNRIKYKLSALLDNRWFSKFLFKDIHESLGNSLRYFLTIGTKIDDSICSQFLNLGFEVLEGYGLAEATSIVTTPVSKRINPSSVGKIFDNIDVKIINGELVLRGPNISPNYCHAEDNKKYKNNGWLFTSDMGYIDDNNYLYIQGVSQDRIRIDDGRIVFAPTVEQMILQYDHIVSEVGIFYDEGTLKAVIVPQPNLLVKFDNADKDRDLIDYIRWNVIEHYNRSVPAYMQVKKIVISRQTLPRSTSGKLKRYLMPDLEIHKDINIDLLLAR